MDTGLMRLSIKDIEYADKIMRDNDIYPFISDDNSLGAESFTTQSFLENPMIHVLSPVLGSILIFIPQNSICYDVHINFTKKVRGETAFKACKKSLDYAFNVIPVKKLTACIPEIYNNVSDFTLKMGFKKEGTFKESFLKDNKLLDQCLFGLTEKEYIEWHQQQ